MVYTSLRSQCQIVVVAGERTVVVGSLSIQVVQARVGKGKKAGEIKGEKILKALFESGVRQFLNQHHLLVHCVDK